MSVRETFRPAGARLADLTEQSAVLELAMPREAALSDAPLYAPQAHSAALLLASLMEAPKEPKEPKEPKKI